MLEQSQKQMSDMINNLMNQGQMGPDSRMNMSQQIFNENRTMMLQMLAPVMTTLNDMKLLYENTKACSNDVG